MEGLGASKTDRRVAQDLWSLMDAAADYSFNRSHAACYALISYRTAWLRANYPAEYMAALISSVMSTKDKVPFFVNRCAEMGIEVLPPDVNTSDHGFVVSGNSIRFGLDAVKNVGHIAVQAILDARAEDGEFASIWDFCERVDTRAVNKRAVECLVKCGAFDSTGASRRGMLEALPAASAFGQKAQEDSRLGQGSIFDLGGGAAESGPSRASTRRRSGPRSSTSASCSASRRRRSGPSSPRTRSPRSGTRCAPGSDCSLSEPRRQAGRLVGHGRRDRHRVQAASDRRAATLMSFATLDDVEGQVEMLVLGKAYRGLGRRSSLPTRSSSSRAGSTTRAGRDQARRAGGRALRAERGRGRQGAGGARDTGAAPPADQRRRVRRQADRGAEGDLRALPRATPRCCSRWRPARAPRGCGSGASTASAAPPACDAELDALLGAGSRAAA